MLDIVASYHRQGKLMIQTHKNGEKPHSRPGLGMLGPNSGRDFFLNVDSSVTRYYVQLSSYTIEKTSEPILKKLSDGWIDGRTDGRK